MHRARFNVKKNLTCPLASIQEHEPKLLSVAAFGRLGLCDRCDRTKSRSEIGLQQILQRFRHVPSWALGGSNPDR